jgi:phage gp46-like protein
MADVLLQQTNDDGEITIAAGEVRQTDGLETAAYLSLFGGNEDDSGLEDGDRLQWWANHAELETSRRQRSETQHIIRSMPLVPANLKQIEDAIGRDLAWMIADGFATSAFAVARITAPKRVELEVSITVNGQEHSFTFTEEGQ